MKLNLAIIVCLITIQTTTAFSASVAEPAHERNFDSDWHFLRADAPSAEVPDFDDGAWRVLDLPHDWSIEDLPSTDGAPSSPFNPALSTGGPASGYTVGGIGWYRKHFTLPAADAGKCVSICFDGVYMNADVWLNGKHLGNHPYGYTPFVFDLTPHLKPAGQENVLAVRVKNVGKTSRWYSGSGIYRHVRLAVADPIHIPFWGVHVLTTNISKEAATVSIVTTVKNDRGADATIRLRSRLIGPDGKAGELKETEISIPAGKQKDFTQELSVKNPALWSLNNPALYRAEVELIENQNALDHSAATFGIRTIKFTAANGFELNGEVVKLKGGNMHHDNGPLGSATIDRAEERRVQLMKAYGFNAIRTSHNPPSPQFLDACDRFGVLVMDEAFDMWEKAKSADDYHLFFKEWWKRDLEAMLLRDRNHPSVILWSIGNEIPERAEASGVAIAKELIAVIRQLDSTRPVTAGICNYWDQPKRPWTDLDPAFEPLDVCGYNYQTGHYVPDHKRFPERVIVGTETFTQALYDNWQNVKTHPWVIGDFVWTSWDYIGETGCGHAVLNGENPNAFPWFNAYCGDIDLCGFKKAGLYSREVVWGDAKINLVVHSPIPEGRRERVSMWGWPDVRQSWTWPGSDGKPLDVVVYSSCPSVRLELNGKVIATNPVNKMTARFKVPYQPGELRAVGLSDDKDVASASLRTAGEAAKIRLTADRTTIRADRNDLCYVTVEVVDQNDNVVPVAANQIRFTVSGAGELAATGNGAPNDASSFRLPSRKAFQGRCLAILRPQGTPGSITLKAESENLKTATLEVKTQ